MQSAQFYIQSLHLQPHPEGGYFAETYRSVERIPSGALPARFSGERPFGTAIYFLLEHDQFSALHRIEADEIWHFYAGGPLEVFVINPDTTLTVIQLGNDPAKGEVFQATVPAGCWFGSAPAEGVNFALVGCTVAPGFNFADFEMGSRVALLAEFPQHHSLIERLTT